MNIQETELTPELAAILLSKPHPHQRRPARQTVEMYARAIREGRWRLVGDPILVDSEKRMFLARKTYEYTGLPPSICLAAYAIASDMAYDQEVDAFVEGVADPSYLPPGDPARLLAERFRKERHRSRRRDMVDDWTILVRAFNMHLQGQETSRLVLSECWPRVAESEREYNLRRQALGEARRRVRSRTVDMARRQPA